MSTVQAQGIHQRLELQENGPSIRVVEFEGHEKRLMSITDLFEAADRARADRYGIAQLVVRNLSFELEPIDHYQERILTELQRITLPGEQWTVRITTYEKPVTQRPDYCVVHMSRTFNTSNS
jgi:Fic family protein